MQAEEIFMGTHAVVALLLFFLPLTSIWVWVMGHWFMRRRRSTGLLFSPSDRVLLVIAHPDDESMFFAPTILQIRGSNIPLFILCLSTGDADGLGKLRQSELVGACEELQVPRSHIKAIDDPMLKDGMNEIWPEHSVRQQVHLCATQNGITKVVTFDAHGISGHPNHISTFYGVRAYCAWRSLMSSAQRSGASALPMLELYTLDTTNIIRKYSGILDLPMSLLLAAKAATSHTILSPSPWTSVWAMTKHRSQLVWFRWLFIMLSRYTYINSLSQAY